LWLPGRSSRATAVAREARAATSLLLGALPLLIIAGVVEGSVSQLHPPTLPYAAKLLFAGIIAVALFGFLLRAGRGSSDPPR
jgi:uncharacterized membrane protein SpoIIM required for sporulation